VACRFAILSAREARENARLSLLEQVSRELNRAHDRAGVKAAIVSILEGMRERFSDSALFYLLEPDKTELVHVVHREPVRVESLSAQVGASACTEPVQALLRGLTELRPRAVSAKSGPVEDARGLSGAGGRARGVEPGAGSAGSARALLRAVVLRARSGGELFQRRGAELDRGDGVALRAVAGDTRGCSRSCALRSTGARPCSPAFRTISRAR
jgi:hypothetical protein